jgi:hypothetical protein
MRGSISSDTWSFEVSNHLLGDVSIFFNKMFFWQERRFAVSLPP